jgi:hypothetical protein
VALAAIVWLGVLIFVLRVLFVVVMAAAGVFCIWLLAAVWWGRVDWREPSVSALRHVWTRARLALAAVPRGPAPTEHGARELEEAEEALAALRRSAEVLAADLRAQERLHADAARLQQELAGQIEAMRGLVGRIAQLEHEASHLAAERPQPNGNGAPPQPARMAAEPDARALLDELEADLRLEKIEEREQELVERERRLDRREREIAAFVAETQSRLS